MKYRIIRRRRANANVESTELGNNPDYYCMVGSGWADVGDFGTAMDAYGQALRLNPKHAGAHGGIAGIYAAQGRWEEAANEYEVALKLAAPTHPSPPTRLSLARAYLEVGRFDDAAVQCHVLLAGPPSYHWLQIDAHILLGRIAMSQDRTDDAISHFRAATELEPELPEGRYYLAQVYRASGRLDEAARLSEAAFQCEPENKDFRELACGIHGDLGNRYMERKCFSDAVREYRRILELNWWIAEAHFNLFWACTQLSDYDTAWEEIKVARDLGLQEAVDFINNLSSGGNA